MHTLCLVLSCLGVADEARARFFERAGVDAVLQEVAELRRVLARSRRRTAPRRAQAPSGTPPQP